MPAPWRQQISELWQLGNKRLSELFSLDIHNNNNVLALTISSDFIKLLKIKSLNGKYRVENFDIVPIPPGLVLKNEIKDPMGIANMINDLYSKHPTMSKNVAICIPRSMAIVKNITVDNRLTMDEIETRVWVEANRLFPKLIDDIYLDFAVMGPSSQDTAKQDVLLVACRKEFIHPYLEVMRLSGLSAKRIDVNYFALERALAVVAKQSPEVKTLALLNIGYTYIDLIVTHEGAATFTHEVSYDGNSLKLMGNHENSSNNTEQIELFKHSLGLQIKHAIQFFYSSRPTMRIESIILSGDCSVAIPDLANYIQLEVNKKMILADPFKDMELAPTIDKEKLKHYASSFMLCCGLTLQKL